MILKQVSKALGSTKASFNQASNMQRPLWFLPHVWPPDPSASGTRWRSEALCWDTTWGLWANCGAGWALFPQPQQMFISPMRTPPTVTHRDNSPTIPPEASAWKALNPQLNIQNVSQHWGNSAPGQNAFNSASVQIILDIISPARPATVASIYSEKRKCSWNHYAASNTQTHHACHCFFR